MGNAGPDAFLSGEGIAVPIARVEDELERLWGPAAQRAGGPELDHPTVTRVSLANLIVASVEDQFDATVRELDALSTRYPCRVIVLRKSDAADHSRGVAAEITARCHLPAPGLPQVCSERIVLSTGPSGLDLLPGAMRSLLEAGLPVVLWWRGDPRSHLQLFTTLSNEATRIIVDLPDPDAQPDAVRIALDLNRHPFARDLAWFGATLWRELIAQFFDSCGAAESLLDLKSVRIEVASPRADRPPRVGLWLIAWLAGQLKWRPSDRHAQSDGEFNARFQGPHGPIEATLLSTADPAAPLCRIRAVELRSENDGTGAAFLASRGGGPDDEVWLESTRAGTCSLPRVLRAPEFDSAKRLAAGLESARIDPPYRDALEIMEWMLADHSE
jgi:glucose-6-phosphate dehydrogenase assembly protein OpcA